MVASNPKGNATMPIESKKQSEAKQEWMKKNSKVFGIRVMKKSEPEMWAYLQGEEPSAIFKAALKEYMERHPKPFVQNDEAQTSE